ncbi:MAG: DUF3473 domain-containing protein, partial [Acidobacteria bacterium]|nr:DUF3473 domain-containing protein [Acidobacteriota bacterium]
FAGGVYMRILPFALVRFWFRQRLAAGDPVAGYSHPYDIDVDQERFMFPEINESRFYNWLMYRNRDQVFPRLEKLLASGVRVMPYRDYVDAELGARVAHVRPSQERLRVDQHPRQQVARRHLQELSGESERAAPGFPLIEDPVDFGFGGRGG